DDRRARAPSGARQPLRLRRGVRHRAQPLLRPGGDRPSAHGVRPRRADARLPRHPPHRALHRARAPESPARRRIPRLQPVHRALLDRGSRREGPARRPEARAPRRDPPPPEPARREGGALLQRRPHAPPRPWARAARALRVAARLAPEHRDRASGPGAHRRHHAARRLAQHPQPHASRRRERRLRRRAPGPSRGGARDAGRGDNLQVTDGRASPSLVSVVIPSFNGARLLAEAVESVLAQTHPAVETIVVDDGSTDDTPALVARWGDRIRYLRQANRGVCAARNAGLAAARGVYVTFLDHDDRFTPEKLARQAAVLDAHPDAGVVYTGWRFIDAEGRPFPPVAWPRHEGDVLAELVIANFVFLGAVMVRRSLLAETGGFDEALRGAEDWELWLRLARHGARWACVDAPLFEYRLHDEQRHRRGAERRATNRIAVLRAVFADPHLPAAVRAREREAYHHAH